MDRQWHDASRDCWCQEERKEDTFSYTMYRSLAARKSFCNYKYVPLQMVNDNDDISSLWIWLDRRRRSSSRIIQDLPHLVGWFGFDAFILIVSSRDLWLVGWMDGIPKNCPYILAFRIIHLVWNSYASPTFPEAIKINDFGLHINVCVKFQFPTWVSRRRQGRRRGDKLLNIDWQPIILDARKTK